MPDVLVAPSPASTVLRLYWALVGHAVVYLSLATIVARHARFPSTLDLVIWAAVALMLVARHVDIVRYGGQTLYGEPATLTQFRRYAATLVGVTAAASVFAHLLAGSL